METVHEAISSLHSFVEYELFIFTFWIGPLHSFCNNYKGKQKKGQVAKNDNENNKKLNDLRMSYVGLTHVVHYQDETIKIYRRKQMNCNYNLLKNYKTSLEK